MKWRSHCTFHIGLDRTPCTETQQFTPGQGRQEDTQCKQSQQNFKKLQEKIFKEKICVYMLQEIKALATPYWVPWIHYCPKEIFCGII